MQDWSSREGCWWVIWETFLWGWLCSLTSMWVSSLQLFIGFGFPYEGPAPLEAIANGCVFLQARFNPPHSSLNHEFFRGKPTSREASPAGGEHVGRMEPPPLHGVSGQPGEEQLLKLRFFGGGGEIFSKCRFDPLSHPRIVSIWSIWMHGAPLWVWGCEGEGGAGDFCGPQTDSSFPVSPEPRTARPLLPNRGDAPLFILLYTKEGCQDLRGVAGLQNPSQACPPLGIQSK